VITSVGLTITVTLPLATVTLGEGVPDDEGIELAGLIGSKHAEISIASRVREILRII